METPGGGGYGSVYKDKQAEKSSIYSKTYNSQYLATRSTSEYKDTKSNRNHNFAERGSVFEYRMTQESV